MGALKSVLHEAGHRTSSTLSQMALGAFRAPVRPVPQKAAVIPLYRQELPLSKEKVYTPAPPVPLYLEEALPENSSLSFPPEGKDLPLLVEHPLGEALAQIHHSYIVAQTATGLLLIDQHAAHERLLYEKMKKDLESQSIPRQVLLVPEVIDLPAAGIELFQKHLKDFAQLGLILEPFGEGAILVREVPHLLKIEDIKIALIDLASNLEALSREKAGHEGIRDLFDLLFASLACRSSIKAGKRLSREEMNALLRQMETTPHAGQCNHGRPTYVTLRLTDIEKLFGRR